MPRQYTGKESISLSEVKKPNGSIYVFERTTWYDRDTKKTRSKRRLLGIKDPETGEVRNTRPRKSTAETNTGAEIAVLRKKNAMISILSYLSDVSGVTKEVTAATRGNRGIREKILTLAWYAFATEGRSWTRAENWTRSFQNELPYNYGPITEDIYQELFREIGSNAELKWHVFRQRARQMGDDELLALDSSTISTTAKTIHNAQNSKDKDGIVKNVYKVVYIYSITARQLLAYDMIPGHVPDCSTVDTALTHLDVLELSPNIEVVQDNGYATDEDIGEYLHRKRHFITRLEPNRKWISSEVERAIHDIRDGDKQTSVIHCDPSFAGKAITITHAFPYKRKYGSTKKAIRAGEIDYIKTRVNVFIYYSIKKKGEDDEKFRIQFEQVREDAMNGAFLDKETKAFLEKYCLTTVGTDGIITEVTLNTKAYQEKLKYNGILVVLADKEKDIESALIKYRSRETIEEGIEGHKGHTGGDTSKPGMMDESLDGELFIEFLANSIRESFRTRLRSMKSALGVPNGVREHDLRSNLEAETKVKNWIRKKSISYLIEYFERKEVTILNDGKKSYKMDGYKTSRDKLFLKHLGVTQESMDNSDCVEHPE